MAQINQSFIRPYESVEGDKTRVKYRGYNGIKELAMAEDLAELVVEFDFRDDYYYANKSIDEIIEAFEQNKLVVGVVPNRPDMGNLTLSVINMDGNAVRFTSLAFDAICTLYWTADDDYKYALLETIVPKEAFVQLHLNINIQPTVNSYGEYVFKLLETDIEIGEILSPILKTMPVIEIPDGTIVGDTTFTYAKVYSTLKIKTHAYGTAFFFRFYADGRLTDERFALLANTDGDGGGYSFIIVAR